MVHEVYVKTLAYKWAKLLQRKSGLKKILKSRNIYANK